MFHVKIKQIYTQKYIFLDIFAIKNEFNNFYLSDNCKIIELPVVTTKYSASVFRYQSTTTKYSHQEYLRNLTF